MCTPAELAKALQKNNHLRDKNLKAFKNSIVEEIKKNRQEILELMESSITKRIEHLRMAPETKITIENMDEKLNRLEEKMQDNESCHELLKNKIQGIELNIMEVRGDLAPIKKIMWLVLTILITGVVGAILALIIKQ